MISLLMGIFALGFGLLTLVHVVAYTALPLTVGAGLVAQWAMGWG